MECEQIDMRKKMLLNQIQNLKVHRKKITNEVITTTKSFHALVFSA